MGKNDAQNKLTSPFWMIKHIQYPSIGCSQKKTKDILSQKFRINSFTLYNCHLSMTGPKMDLFFSCHKFPPPPKKKNIRFEKLPKHQQKTHHFFGISRISPLILGYPPNFPLKGYYQTKNRAFCYKVAPGSWFFSWSSRALAPYLDGQLWSIASFYPLPETIGRARRVERSWVFSRKEWNAPRGLAKGKAPG